ncbi:exopolyphosphatase [Martelella endophytica]|uniref:exopolyphosphatase n=1 Tax=Martelella endophytica TaxID=1486262 RepID=A0A0D5LQ22_MAREN|nr:exopolyphosphatase [Martelella endophytica]AJY46035.1 exopolyphosphatase [Martelella endophytica]
MVESEAQGRLPGISPVSVVDIGSNSVRIVIYEGLSRAPTVLFNEKVLCGLGRGIAATGKMNEEGVERALQALKRFKALSVQARAGTMHVLATAAAREAANGPAFIDAATEILGTEVRVLTGKEEARYSAYGVISGFFEPDGIAGDLGGGSLELIDIKDKTYGDGITLPLGGIRLSELSEGSLAKARNFVKKQVKKVAFLEKGRDRTFYAVGGTWRNIARLHMEFNNYPLTMMQGYEIGFQDMMAFLDKIGEDEEQKDPAWQAISKNRRMLLPYGAIAMREVLSIMQPKSICFSAQGVREGLLYSLLSTEDQQQDALLVASQQLAILRARSPKHANEIANWTGLMMRRFGVEETPEEARYRQAACLLADISWRAHPDFRGSQSLNVIAHSSLIGITHPGRVFIALSNYYRFEGLRDDHHTDGLGSIATPEVLERAKLLGGLLRVAYLFSASMPGVVGALDFLPSQEKGVDLELVVPEMYGDFIGERVEGRLDQLAKLTGKTLAIARV